MSIADIPPANGLACGTTPLQHLSCPRLYSAPLTHAPVPPETPLLETGLCPSTLILTYITLSGALGHTLHWTLSSAPPRAGMRQFLQSSAVVQLHHLLKHWQEAQRQESFKHSIQFCPVKVRLEFRDSLSTS